MREITILKGDEFKIAVKDKIEENDIFFEEYRRAAEMLNEITGAWISKKARQREWSWKEQDFENNIIAFCGERGEGKSSAMMTFVNAVYEDKKKENKVFSACRFLKEVRFLTPILIDPTQFDDVHNVLDIVLAKIFQNFYMECNDDTSSYERNREQLLDRFQKVYRYISLINNQKQMLDDEFDYEGNISKLTKLGESTKLKEELSKLIAEYLSFMDQSEKQHQLIIAIDDLDLCSANAYKMAEQIRKYLMIPNVSIVISVKIDQLELCIREKNLKDFEEIYKNKEEAVYRQLNNEVSTMSERYISKLIPKQRRIYLPKVQSFDQIHITYKDRENDTIIWESVQPEEGEKNFTSVMLDMIYKATGMRFLPEEGGKSYLFPNNLRDMISWIALIGNFSKTENKENGYLENIQEFERYVQREWTEDHLKLYEGLTLQDIETMDAYHMHIAVKRILEGIYSEINPGYDPKYHVPTHDRMDSFYQVIGWFYIFKKNVVDIGTEGYISRLRTIYTIRMNRWLNSGEQTEQTEFMNGYLFGEYFSNVLPAHANSGMDRSRFPVPTIECYNQILKMIKSNLPELPVPEYGKIYKISKIKQDENRTCYLQAWIVLGLLSNIFYTNNNQVVFSSDRTVIYDNNSINYFIHVSLENYLVGLSDLDAIYDKVNMARLGIKEEEFKETIRRMQEENKEIIECAKKLICNVDLILGMKDYCIKHRDYKEDTTDDTDRCRKLADTFLKNTAEYMNQNGIACTPEKFQTFSLGDEKEPMAVSSLYAELFDLSLANRNVQKEFERKKKVDDLVSEFRRKLVEMPDYWNPKEVAVPKTLRKLTAENLKLHLDDLASNIQRYNGITKKPLEHVDVEGLCRLYGAIADLYIRNKELNVPEELYGEYKRLVLIQDQIKLEES